MDVMLLYPRTPDTKGSKQPPLGILYIASSLRSQGIEPILVDLTFDGFPALEKALEWHWDYIGISVSSPVASNARRAIGMIRERSNAWIIAGGPHPTVVRDLAADQYVIGEGESAFCDIIKNSIRWKLIYGASPNIIGVPARDLLDCRYKRQKFVPLMAGRGCPYNCLYCQPMQRRLFGDKVRLRPVDDVIAEIKTIPKGKTLWFEDDTFTWDAAWLKEFCIKISPLRRKWRCNTRVDCIDEAKLRMMRDAGCVYISYGVESGSQKILNFMRKGTTVRQIRQAFRLTRDAKIFAFAYVIIGTPTETEDDLEATAKLVRGIRPNGIQISTMTPMPGTDLEAYCRDNGTLSIADSDDYHYCANKSPIRLEIPAKALETFRRRIYAAFLLGGGWIKF